MPCKSLSELSSLSAVVLLLFTIVDVNEDIIFCNESADACFYAFSCLFYYLSDSTNFLTVSDPLVSGLVEAPVTVTLLESNNVFAELVIWFFV